MNLPTTGAETAPEVPEDILAPEPAAEAASGGDPDIEVPVEEPPATPPAAQEPRAEAPPVQDPP